MTKLKRIYVIAEAGVNHNGCLDTAKRMIEVAAQSGADATKFQTFRADSIVSRTAAKADYQIRNTGASESQYEMIRKLELDEAAHEVLIAHCALHNIEFLSTPFDLDSVDLLCERFDLSRIKFSSGEITNAPLLLKVAATGKPVILSTGMCTLGEIEAALGVLAFGYLNLGSTPSLAAFSAAYCSDDGMRVLRGKVTILHCTTEYPAPLLEVNLLAMDTMRNAFALPVGFSDHTAGIYVAIAAAARGAIVIEKHFTLDKNMSGPDHKASLEPMELKAMITAIRIVEQALGTPLKSPSPSELRNIPIARKSLVALKVIKEGELFTAENLGCKRPGTGISPMRYWDFLGKKADKVYLVDEKISS